jgi:hypothetical protein
MEQHDIMGKTSNTGEDTRGDYNAVKAEKLDL